MVEMHIYSRQDFIVYVSIPKKEVNVYSKLDGSLIGSWPASKIWDNVCRQGQINVRAVTRIADGRVEEWIYSKEPIHKDLVSVYYRFQAEGEYDVTDKLPHMFQSNAVPGT
jgi:hypothetical protein